MLQMQRLQPRLREFRRSIIPHTQMHLERQCQDNHGVHAMTTTHKSWTAETLAEHAHTLATLHMLMRATLHHDEYTRHRELTADALRCSQDLWQRMNEHGIRSLTTSTHTATLMANGTVNVQRKTE